MIYTRVLNRSALAVPESLGHLGRWRLTMVLSSASSQQYAAAGRNWFGKCPVSRQLPSGDRSGLACRTGAVINERRLQSCRWAEKSIAFAEEPLP
jgi:hypothetical protein